MVSLAEILRRHWPAYEARHGPRLLASHRRAVAAILRCRTAALGGQLFRCAQCAQRHFAYHSCHHRACPQCGHRQASEWIARQQSRLLPVPYFLVTFTVPKELRPFIRREQKLWYTLLFAQSAATLQDVARLPKYLGAQLGLLGVLQTWTRDLRFHPHLHYLVPGGGLRPDRLRWMRPPTPEFFLPAQVLAARFRNRIRQALQSSSPQLLPRIPPQVWHGKWVVDVQSVGGGLSALKYLSAYVTRTAITASRLLDFDEESVTFAWRQSHSGNWRTTRLPAEQFLHRFLQHVLPKGFQRVRYFGWLSAAATSRWERILALLDWRPPALAQLPPLPLPECPRCHRPMICVGFLPRPPP